MRYRISFTLETDAPLEQVNKHFADMSQGAHEVVALDSEGAETAWDAYMSSVEVKELP